MGKMINQRWSIFNTITENVSENGNGVFIGVVSVYSAKLPMKVDSQSL